MRKTKRPDLVKPPHAVFEKIDMMGGNPHVCWPWKGTFKNAKSRIPIHYAFCTRVSARRLVYSLKKGMHISNVPRLTMLCGNDECCNFNHMAPEGTVKVDKKVAV